MSVSTITASPHACTSAGIEIAGRMPLEAPINADNRRSPRLCVRDTALIA
jgi:hypothetical protein